MAIKTKIFEYIEFKYDDLTHQINTWLKSEHNKSGINFNTASPYGQIINLLKELFQHNIIYLKNVIKNLDIRQTNNKKVVQQIARISGYSTSRAISATGTLKFTLKNGVNVNEDIKDSIIVIENKLLIKNKTNTLKYTIKINGEQNIYPLSKNNSTFYVPVIQGEYESQRFTGKGVNNQTFSVNIPGTKQIENFNYEISYNGILLNIKDHIFDMLPNEKCCVVKSGFNGGIDIQFGNSNYGIVPSRGSIIEVKYLLTDGSIGEINNNIIDDWSFLGQVKDGQGNDLDVEKLFNIYIVNDINFASDGESIEFTKQTIPHVSRNFVLGTPNQFIFHLKKLNMFSKVNAYNKLEDNNFAISGSVIENQIKKLSNSINKSESKSKIISDVNKLNTLYSKFKNNLNDNVIYLYLIPHIKKYFNGNINYFNVPFDAFYLDTEEEKKVNQYLKQLGTLSISTEIKIIQPEITKFVMHIYIRRFDYANEDNIRQEIIAKCSEYLLTNDRFDRIPKSDFIQIIKSIDGVDSASVYFISKKNEDYHKKAIKLGYTQPNIKTPKFTSTKYPNDISKEPKFNNDIISDLSSGSITKNGITKPNIAYDPNLTFGIDTVHGDIIIGKNEYAVIRGGWKDRNDIWYNENPNDDELNSINIVFNGITNK